MVKTIMNSSDREELAVLKTDIKYLKTNVESIDKKLGEFISCADKKYATKEELVYVTEKMKDADLRSKEGKGWMWEIFKTVLPWLAVALLAIIQFSAQNIAFCPK